MKPSLRLPTGIAVAVMLVAVIWLLPSLFAPRLYQSVARIRVGPPPEGGINQDFDISQFATEMEIICSETTLLGVLNDLNLIAVWNARESREFSQAQAIALLRDRLVVEPYRKTTIVEIHAASPEAAEAARIANAVAETYLRHQRDRRTGRAGGRLQTLRQEVELTEAELAEAQAALLKLREQVTLDSAPSATLKIQEDLAEERFAAARRLVQTAITQLQRYELETSIQPDTAEVITQAVPGDLRRRWRGER